VGAAAADVSAGDGHEHRFCSELTHTLMLMLMTDAWAIADCSTLRLRHF